MTRRRASIDTKVEDAVGKLLDDAKTFDERAVAIDKALKLQAMKIKMADDEMGRGFDFGGESDDR